MFVIETTDFKDLATILTLQKFCYQENARRYSNNNILPLMQTMQDIELEFSRCTFFKVVENDTIIGSIRAYRTQNTCFIVRLFVHPDFQNRGIGSQLMRKIEDSFPDVQRYELFTGYKDDKNRALYKKLGYHEFREEARDDGMIFIFLEKMNTINQQMHPHNKLR